MSACAAQRQQATGTSNSLCEGYSDRYPPLSTRGQSHSYHLGVSAMATKREVGRNAFAAGAVTQQVPVHCKLIIASVQANNSAG